MASSVSGSTVQYDSVSGYPYTHLSFTLNRFLPVRHLNIINDTATQHSIEDKILQQFPNNEHIHHEFTGATFERLMTPHVYDYTKQDVDVPLDFTEVQRHVTKIALNSDQWMHDIQRNLSLQKPDMVWMIVPVTKLVGEDRNAQSKDIRFILDQKECHPGYSRLKIVNPSNTDESFKVKVKAKSLDYYLSSDALNADFQLDLVSKKQQLLQILSSLSHDTLDTAGIDQYLDQTNTINVILGLPCISWPQVAKNWVTRERKSGWPNTTIINDVMHAGVYLTHEAHVSSSRPDIEWKICFAKAEKQLARYLNEGQRQVIILLKVIIYYHFNQSKLLGCKHVKNAAFWVFESVTQSQFSIENLGKCFIIVLEKITSFIESGKFPDYFVPENNLVGKLRSNEKKKIMEVMKKIRKNPIKCLTEFTETYQLIFLPYIKEMEEILEPVTSHKGLGGGNDVISSACKIKQLEVLDGLALEHMREYAYVEAVNIYEEYAALYSRIAKPNNFKAEYKVMSVASTLENAQILMIYRILLEKFPDSEYGLEILSILAEQYEKAYFNTENPENKTFYQDKAEEYYTCAITMTNCQLTTKVEFARFLHYLKMYNTSIDLIEGEIETEKALHSETAIAYGMVDLPRLDSVLQKLTTKQGICVIPAIILGHYIVTTGYKNINKNEQAQISLLKFKLSCEKLEESDTWRKPIVRQSMFALLGHTAEELKHYDIAVESFEKAKSFSK